VRKYSFGFRLEEGSWKLEFGIWKSQYGRQESENGNLTNATTIEKYLLIFFTYVPEE
jgi:hypothetical protein